MLIFWAGSGMQDALFKTYEECCIANISVENFSRMFKRRIVATMGVTYATTPDQLRELVRQFEQILKNHPGIDQEFMIVKFNNFGPSSLDILLYFFTKTTDWVEWLEIKEELYLTFMNIVDSVGTSFAFPSQSIYIEQLPENEKLPPELERMA